MRLKIHTMCDCHFVVVVVVSFPFLVLVLVLFSLNSTRELEEISPL